MWKREKNSTAIRRRSKTPGVMITQYSASLPEGKSTPDFQCKPVPVTIPEGKLAVFRAVVTGDPKPDVSWRRAKGTITDKEKFQRKFDESTGEHILEVMTATESDTYKCSAVNEYGKAVCTTTLSVIDGKFFLYFFLHKFLCFSKEERAGGENDEKFWDALLNAERKDYEHICKENGITDLHLILKKLEEKKKQRGQINNGPLQNESGLYPGFPAVAQINISNQKLNQAGTEEDLLLMEFKRRFYRNNLGCSAVATLIYNHVFAVSNVDFVIKIQEINVEEADNALFECVLTHPLPQITWMRKGLILEDGEKYSITVSEHKLIHRLMIKDCKKTDKGIYSAVAGITSCSAWLVVEDHKSGGKKTIHKTTLAGGLQKDLEIVAKEQQLKNQEEMEKILEAIKVKQAAEKVRNGKTLKINGEYCNGTDQHLRTEDKSSEEDIRVGALEDQWSAKEGAEKNCVFFSDPGVHFIWGLSDVDAIINETAELTCKLSSDDYEGAWFRDGKKISSDDIFFITKDGPIHKLVIIKCAEDHSGKYRFEADGRKTEAMVNVKDPPRFNPEDLCAFTEPLAIKVGHNAIFKVQFVGHQPIKIQWFRDGDDLQDDSSAKIENSAGHSRLLLSRCQRKDMGEIKIKLKNEHGFTEALSKLLVLDKPSPPQGPAEVTESSASCIEFKWRPPKDDGGSPVISYMLERQQVGRNTWKKIGEMKGGPTYRDTDVDRGRRYCYRIRAVTTEGISEAMETDDMQAGTFALPGPPTPPQVISTFHDCINLSWSPPSNTGGSRILGYVLEKRKKGSNLWSVVNAADELIKGLKYAVRDVVEGIEYEFKVSAVNLSGAGESSNPSEFAFARDPKIRPKFTKRMKNFMVVKAGNSVRITVNFEASPRPEIVWLKDNVLVSKRVTVSNSDCSSQLLIPISERSDSGVYSILVKNLVGQETSSTEIRVTDDPKPPGLVELEENVPGTVTVMWEPSPDEKRDDRLHYTVSKLDSSKRTWTPVADRLFNNRFTVCNIVHGREYHFRVFAKNDMGISEPSESPTWGTEKKKGGFDCDLRCAPTFIVPLKLHTATRGYECYMSCAVKGNPSPHITWYRNHVSLNTDTNYYISNTCGVCSLAILSVGPKDRGEYTVIAENSLGRAECSTFLSVRGEWGMGTHSVTLRGLILIFLFCLSFRLNKLRTSVIR
uniref:Immunoglobulin like and fibronectin type III domain containing 1, tandem duplicate 3 n=1 Tax=Oryzias latipes TaxID=8090 RepID=A0A3P9L1D9_ORYLA